MLVCPTCQATYHRDLYFCGRCGSDVRRAPPTVPAEDLWVGRVVDGRYRVEERIGQGGMGAVYRVTHLAMGKVAAMKVLHRDAPCGAPPGAAALATDDEAHRRFRREAEAVSRLGHPNTVQVFDFGEI